MQPGNVACVVGKNVLCILKVYCACNVVQVRLHIMILSKRAVYCYRWKLDIALLLLQFDSFLPFGLANTYIGCVSTSMLVAYAFTFVLFFQ